MLAQSAGRVLNYLRNLIRCFAESGGEELTKGINPLKSTTCQYLALPIQEADQSSQSRYPRRRIPQG